MPALNSPRRLADVGAEAVLIAGGGRAILLQLANPAVGHAVAAHSRFAEDPLRRLRTTLTYVYALVYGTPAQVGAVRRMVNDAHAPVASTGSADPPAHPPYDARDPRLQLWVAATLYETAAVVRDHLLTPLDEGDEDAVYEDYARLGTALQVPEGAWPASRAEFGEYWTAELAALSVDDTVRAVAHELLYPRTGPLWLRAAMPLGRLITAGLLPEEIRSAYGMPWSPGRERRYEAVMRVISVVNRMLPRGIREWPKNRLLRDLD